MTGGGGRELPSSLQNGEDIQLARLEMRLLFLSISQPRMHQN